MSQGDVMSGAAFLSRPEREFGKPVWRLGLASHGRTAITAGDVLHAVSRGVNFLNWSGFGSFCSSRQFRSYWRPAYPGGTRRRLEGLSASGPLPAEEYEALARHGERVRVHAGQFA